MIAPWGGPSPPAVAYVFADGRGTEGDRRATDRLLRHSAGRRLCRLQGAGARSCGAIRLAFCLAHARRKFVEVYKTTQSPFAREVIERLQAVYAIEAEIRGLDAEQRLAPAAVETQPLMEALKARLIAMLGPDLSPVDADGGHQLYARITGTG